jgi:hypothetical protein
VAERAEDPAIVKALGELAASAASCAAHSGVID